MKNLIAFLGAQRDAGLLIGRILGGYVICYAGYLKLFQLGFSGTGDLFQRMGIFLPQVTGPFIGLLEFFGGAAIIVGLFTRYLGVLFTIEFIVALVVVKMGGGYSNFRIDVALIGFAVLWATQGAGSLSVDSKMRLGN